MEIVKSWYNYSLRDDRGIRWDDLKKERRRNSYTLIQHIPYRVIKQDMALPLDEAVEESEKMIKALTE